MFKLKKGMETDCERQTNDLRLLKIRMGSDACVGRDWLSKMAKKQCELGL